MATQNSENNTSHPKENETKKTIGAVGGILVLLVLLFVGVSQSKSAGAELITEEEAPKKTTYESEASELNFEKAKLKEYETGKLIEFSGKVSREFEEALKGEAAFLLDLRQNEQNDAPATTEKNQVILTFLENPEKVEQPMNVHVYGRYIGTLEYETVVGTKKEVPAIQVDYFSGN